MDRPDDPKQEKNEPEVPRKSAAAHRAESGYQFFDPDMISRIKHIRQLQDQRLSIREIRERLGDKL